MLDRFNNPPGYPSSVPDADLKMFLPERYPCCVNASLGINDERVISWMQPAAFASFNKIYGVLPYGLPAGNHTLHITRRMRSKHGILRLKLLAGPAVGETFRQATVITMATLVCVNGLMIVFFFLKRIYCPRIRGFDARHGQNRNDSRG